MIDLTHFLVYKTIQKQHNSLKKTKGTKYSHKSVILWKFSLLNLLQTFRPRGVILFFLRTTRGERKSELIQIDCKKEERLGRREEKKARVLTDTKKFDHISPVLRELGWPSIKDQLLVRDTIYLSIQNC